MSTPTEPAASPASSAGPPALRAVFAALDADQVRWCLLRGADELDADHDEVDLLVHPADLGAFADAVARAGDFAPRPAWGRGPHRFFVNAAPGAPIKLDVVTGFAFGHHAELRTDDTVAAAVLARRRHAGALALPAPSDAFWALLLHATLDRPTIRAGRAAELRRLAAHADDGSPLAAVFAAACPPQWDARRVREAAATGASDELVTLAPTLRRRWPGASPPRRLGRVAVSRIQRRADRSRPVRAWRARRAGAGQISGLMTSNSRLSQTG